MIQPLALVLYEKLLPGSQLVNKLQDAGYRVQTASDADALLRLANEGGALVLFADLRSSKGDILKAITSLRQTPATSHLPIVAFGSDDSASGQGVATAAGVTLVVSEAALVHHLPEVLEQALQV